MAVNETNLARFYPDAGLIARRMHVVAASRATLSRAAAMKEGYADAADQWKKLSSRDAGRHAAALGLARCRRADQGQIWLRHRAVRDLQAPYRWLCSPILCNAREPMLLAEALDADLDRATVELSSPDETLYADPILHMQATGNSTSARSSWLELRRAAATARQMLVSAAVAEWHVDHSQCVTQGAFILWRSSR